MAYKFNTVRKGYDPQEVDAFIATLETALNAYKEKDASISNAVVNAQVVADSIITNAEKKAAEIKTDYLTQIETMERVIDAQKKNIDRFCLEYQNLVETKFKEPIEDTLQRLTNCLDDLQDHTEIMQSKTESTMTAKPFAVPSKDSEPDRYNAETDEFRQQLERKVLNSQTGE